MARLVVLFALVLAVISPALAADGPPPETAAEIPAPSAVPYTPPACVGIFPDVPCSHQFATWIEQLYRDRITTGCGGGNYCPSSYVTRGQMAAFLERMARGTDRWPANTALVQQVLNDDGSHNSVASGQALRDAIAAIPTSGPMAPASSNRYVVYLGPGRFDLGDSDFTVPQYVSLRGAGERSTRIVKGGEHSLFLAGENEVAELEIYRSVGQVSLYGVSVFGTAFFDNATVWVMGGTSWVIGIYVNDGALHLSTTRVYVWSDSGTQHAVYLASGADSGSVGHSELWGYDGPVRHGASTAVPFKIGHSVLATAPILAGPGSYRCAYLVDVTNYTPVTCP